MKTLIKPGATNAAKAWRSHTQPALTTHGCTRDQQLYGNTTAILFGLAGSAACFYGMSKASAGSSLVPILLLVWLGVIASAFVCRFFVMKWRKRSTTKRVKLYCEAGDILEIPHNLDLLWCHLLTKAGIDKYDTVLADMTPHYETFYDLQPYFQHFRQEYLLSQDKQKELERQVTAVLAPIVEQLAERKRLAEEAERHQQSVERHAAAMNVAPVLEA